MISRNEHPRPDFIRPDWMDLAGEWSFAVDDKNKGLREQWFMDGEHFTQVIVVPYTYETVMSGLHDEVAHCVVWYRRSFVLPEEMQGRTVLLHFGAVLDSCEVYVNTFKVGEHRGGYTDFSMDITDYISDGENDLCVRVVRLDTPKDCAIGLWQTAYLEAAGNPYLTRIHITPETERGMALIELTLNRDFALPVTAKLHITHEGQTVAMQSVEMHGKQIRTCVDLTRRLKLWSPETPNLYDMRVEISGGDSVYTYFGMRRFACADGCVTLNGKPIFLCLTADEGRWETGGITPPMREALHMDIRRAHRFGFNAILKRTKIEDPRYYYLADRAGMSVFCAMPDSGDVTERAGLLAEVIERDYNHPCIAAWIPMDAEDGRSFGERRRFEALRRILCEEAIVLDPARLVVVRNEKANWKELANGDEALYIAPLKCEGESDALIEALTSSVDEIIGEANVCGCFVPCFIETESSVQGLVTPHRENRVEPNRFSVQLARLKKHFE